jgi:hypothetical protein
VTEVKREGRNLTRGSELTEKSGAAERTRGEKKRRDINARGQWSGVRKERERMGWVIRGKELERERK